MIVSNEQQRDSAIHIHVSMYRSKISPLWKVINALSFGPGSPSVFHSLWILMSWILIKQDKDIYHKLVT